MSNIEPSLNDIESWLKTHINVSDLPLSEIIENFIALKVIEKTKTIIRCTNYGKDKNEQNDL